MSHPRFHKFSAYRSGLAPTLNGLVMIADRIVAQDVPCASFVDPFEEEIIGRLADPAVVEKPPGTVLLPPLSMDDIWHRLCRSPAAAIFLCLHERAVQGLMALPESNKIERRCGRHAEIGGDDVRAFDRTQM